MIYKMKRELYSNLKNGLGYDTVTCKPYKRNAMKHDEIVAWANLQVSTNITDIQIY